MKYLAFFFVTVLILCGCNSKSTTQTKSQPTIIEVDTVDYWFGDITQHQDSVTHMFSIKNVGENDLVISKVDVSCHCISVTYTQKPVHPGDKAFINIKYDASDPPGYFMRSAVVHSNANISLLSFLVRGNITE